MILKLDTFSAELLRDFLTDMHAREVEKDIDSEWFDQMNGIEVIIETIETAIQTCPQCGQPKLEKTVEGGGGVMMYIDDCTACDYAQAYTTEPEPEPEPTRALDTKETQS